MGKKHEMGKTEKHEMGKTEKHGVFPKLPYRPVSEKRDDCRLAGRSMSVDCTDCTDSLLAARTASAECSVPARGRMAAMSPSSGLSYERLPGSGLEKIPESSTGILTRIRAIPTDLARAAAAAAADEYDSAEWEREAVIAAGDRVVGDTRSLSSTSLMKLSSRVKERGRPGVPSIDVRVPSMYGGVCK